MHKIFMFFLGLFSLAAFPFEIDGKYAVVTGRNPTGVERKAAEVLVDYLKEMLGVVPSLMEESGFDGKTPAIFVGQTVRARQEKAEAVAFAAEEWYIKALSGGDLLITGGVPRGTLYGVYDFLEFAGCRYFAVGEKYIPRLKTISVPDTLLINKKPVMEYRYNFLGFTGYVPREFFSWNKQNGDASMEGTYPDAVYNAQQWGHCATFHLLSLKLKERKPEFFSLSKEGVRQISKNGNGPGQFCFSNDELRAELKEVLRKEMASTDPLKQYDTYVIDINDNNQHCHCDGCKNLHERYGASGAYLDFVNDLAAEFPDKKFLMHAYFWTEEPPKPGIRARSNVIIRWAYLGYEWSGRTDTMRPLEASVNRETLQNMQGWLPFADQFGIWDYLVIGQLNGAAPYTCIPAMKENFKLYGKYGITRYFSEIELGKNIQVMSFYDLAIYLNVKLMEDPHRDAEKVITDFMTKYYGAASEVMHLLFRDLVRLQTENPRSLGTAPPAQWEHLNLDFFIHADQKLTLAEKLVAAEPDALRRVKFERLPMDHILLMKFDTLEKQQGFPSTWNKKEIGERLLGNFYAGIDRFVAPGERDAAKKNAERRVANLTGVQDIPPQFPKGRTVQRSVSLGGFSRTVVSDSDAFDGKAICLSAEIEASTHAKLPLQLGIYDAAKQRDVVKFILPKENTPKDGRYHIYRIGTFCPARCGRLTGWAHWTWRVRFPVNVPDAEKGYCLYVSMKVTGPAYVEDCQPGVPDALYIDRIFYVEMEPELPPEFPAEKSTVFSYAKNQAYHSWFRGKDISEFDAFEGKAIHLGGTEESHRKPLILGIFDKKNKRDIIKFTVKPDGIPEDEKFHFHKIGTIPPGSERELFGWIDESWGMQFPRPDIKPDKSYDVFVSLKITGSAYLQNSRLPSDVFCDRVIYVEQE